MSRKFLALSVVPATILLATALTMGTAQACNMPPPIPTTSTHQGNVALSWGPNCKDYTTPYWTCPVVKQYTAFDAANTWWPWPTCSTPCGTLTKTYIGNRRYMVLTAEANELLTAGNWANSWYTYMDVNDPTYTQTLAWNGEPKPLRKLMVDDGVKHHMRILSVYASLYSPDFDEVQPSEPCPDDAVSCGK